MNPTLPYAFQRLRSAWATRSAAIRAHVEADLRSALPIPGQPFHGQQALVMRASGPTSNLPYYLPQTILAFGLAMAFAVTAWLVRAVAEPSMWSSGFALALALASGICIWQALARRFGPPLIDAQRWADARDSLVRSGDGQTRPPGVALMTILALVFGLDGFVSGFTLTSELFGSVLSPRLALASSLAFSMVTAFLLFELTRFAALETARNRRRSMIRALLASPNVADHQRAEAMIDAVGAQLDHDFSQAANRSRARWTLAIVVLSLTVATFVVRVHSERQVGLDSAAETAETWPQR